MELPKIKHEREFLQEPQTFKETEELQEKCNSADELMEYKNFCMKIETMANEIHIKDEPPTNLVESFTERDCSAQFNLQASNTTRAEITTLKCKFCPVILTTKRLLDSHELTHPNKKPWEGKYNLCEKTYSTKHMSTVYLRKYAGAKPFECVTCGHKFASNCDLIKHVRTHTGEKPFKCIACGRQFARKDYLSMHVKKHTGEKPFECFTCGYKCSMRGALIRHIKTHTGEKPFECFTCGHKYPTKGALILHIKTHTGDKPMDTKQIQYPVVHIECLLFAT